MGAAQQASLLRAQTPTVMVYKAATATLTPEQRDVTVTAAATITLPRASEAYGIYTVFSTTTDNVVVQTAEEASPLITKTLTNANDEIVLYSNGYRWYLLTYTISTREA